MKAGIYLGKENVEIRELPLPEVGDNDVNTIKERISICTNEKTFSSIVMRFFLSSKKNKCSKKLFTNIKKCDTIYKESRQGFLKRFPEHHLKASSEDSFEGDESLLTNTSIFRRLYGRNR